MATARTCDSCGQSPAHRIEASLAMWNVARADQPTANIQGADSCMSCQEHVIAVLQRAAMESLREQSGLHAAMIQAEEEREVAGEELRRFNATRDTTKGLTADQRADLEALEQAVAKAEEKRVTAWQKGQSLAEARDKLVAAELKKK